MPRYFVDVTRLSLFYNYCSHTLTLYLFTLLYLSLPVEGLPGSHHVHYLLLGLILCLVTVLRFSTQMEELDDHNIQIAPPGFHLMFLPFADDFRKVKLDTEVARGW